MVLTPFGELPDKLAARLSMAEQFEYLRSRISRRRFLAAGGLTVGAAATAGWLLRGDTGLWMQSDPLAAGTPIGPRHVSFGADPAREAVVSFSVPGSFRGSSVRYGLDSSFGSTAGVDALTVPGTATVYGHAQLTGLTPGSRYFYQVSADGEVSATSSFVAAPAGPAAFTFTAFGDEAVSTPAVRILDQIRTIGPAFHLLAGDICYADSAGSGQKSDAFNPAVWDRWLSMIEPVAASTPWMCATGNHDMEPGYGIHGYAGYLNRFPVPATGAPGCPTTHTFRYGNVAVIALDANDVSYEIPHNLGYSAGAQTRWLENTLTSCRAAESGVDFIVVYYHHCAYSTSSKHGSDAGIREHWVPLLERFDVDLVINGHAHQYERAYPVRAGQITIRPARGDTINSRVSGPTHITAGGGGAPASDQFHGKGQSTLTEHDGTRTPETAPWSAPTRTNTHAFLAVTVTPTGPAGTTMHVRAIDDTGVLIDEITLYREPATV